LQNLRASRQTGLEESFATHVVCNWIVSGAKVTQKHDLQTTEDHFKKATQLPAALARHASHAGAFDPEKSGHQQKRGWKLAEVGLEPASKNTGFGFTADESGNPGGNFQSIFANLLHSEYGFSPDDVVKILQAADRVMLSEP